MKSNHKIRILLAAVSLALTAPSALAATLTWDITSGDNPTITAGTGAWNTTGTNLVWNNNANPNVAWTQTSATVATNAAVFAGADGTHAVTLSGTVNAQSVTFNNSGYSLTGGTLILKPTSTTNGPIIVAADKTATINSAISYASNARADITANSGATLNLGGGASNSQYRFAGAGTVNMTANTYSSNVGNVNVATFNQTGGTYNMNLSTSGDGYFIGFNAGRNVTYTMSGSSIINANAGADTSVNSVLGIGRAAGNTALTNTLNVQGSATLNVGTTALRSGEIHIAYDANANGTLNVSGGTVTVGTGSDANKIYFHKAGAGLGFTATMTQSTGTVTANGIQFGGSTGTYDAASSATLQLSGGNLYVGAQGITRGSAASALPVAIKLQGGTIGASDNWSSSLGMKLGATGSTFQAATSAAVSKNITLSGILSDDDSVNGTLTKTGAGTLTLSGANTYTGATTINAGTLTLGASNVLPDLTAVSIGAATGTATLNAATFADTAGTLDVTAGAAINLGAGAALAFADSSAIDWTGGTLNITGTLGATSLRFGTTSGGLTRDQLGKITSDLYSSFTLNPDGYLVGVTSDTTPPTLASIVDNKDGGAIAVGTVVTYTVTFNEPMNAATINAADFVNAGNATCTIGTVTSVSSTVFTVQATATTAGTLILQIPTTATITDAVANPLDCDPALPDDTTITVNTTPAPTLNATDIVDNRAGQPVNQNTLVTYTLTFNEDMDDATVTAADFGNAGTANISIGTITEISPGVFTVEVTPTGLGTIQLKVNADAVIKAAVSTNVLNTVPAIVDADTITVGSNYRFWDTTPGDGATITAGSGAWDLAASNWNDGITNVIWSQTSTTDGSNNAIFAGADGTANQYVVTIGATAMAAESVTFNNSGYQITGGTLALIVSPTVTGPPVVAGVNGGITVAAGKTATISSLITYADNKAANITANSGATLNLGGGATNSQYSFTGAGIVNMNAGTYFADVGKVNVATFNQSGGTFNMELPEAAGGQYAIGFTAGRSVTYTLSGNATINANGNNANDTEAFLAIGRSANNTAYTNTLNVTGTATLNVGIAGTTVTARAGELLIASNASSNGTLNVTGGTVLVSGVASNKIYFFKAGSGANYTANLTQSGGTITANGIQFGGTTGTYDAGSAANLTLSGGSLYVGAQGIMRGSAASALPVTIKLEGGTLGANQNWTSSLNMQLGATAGGVTIRAQDATTNGRSITLSGNLSDVSGVNGTLTKTGVSDLILSGTNSYSGGTTVNAGRLFISGSSVSNIANALLSTGVVTVNTGSLILNADGSPAFAQSISLNTGANLSMRKAATLSNVSLATTGIVTFNQDDTATQAFSLGSNVGLTGNLSIQVGGGTAAPGNINLTGVISGSVGNLTKSGPGTLTLSGSNSYTGATVVSAGTLDLGAADAVSSSSSLTIASGAALALSSSSSTVPSLTFGGAGTLSFDVASGYILTVNGTDSVTNSGVAGSVTINITGAAPATGTYTLVDYSGTLQGSGFSAYTLGSAPAGKTYALNNNSDTGAVELVVTSVYNWTGATGSEWSTASGLNNWNKDGVSINYANDLGVIFDNTATNQIVDITGADVTPLSVLFNSGTYTLQSSSGYKIAGSATVTVASGATLKLGSSNVLPDGPGAGNVVINGTLDLNGNSDTINALTGAGSVDNTLTATTSTLTVGANAGGIFPGTLKNTVGTLALTKTGATDVNLSGTNTYSGATTVNAGRLFIGSATALPTGNAVTVNNAGGLVLNVAASPTFAQSITLNSGSKLSARQAATLSNVTLPASGSVMLNNDDVATSALTLSSANALSGALTVQVGGGATPGAVTLSGILSGSGGSLVKTGSGQLTLRGANTFGGGVTIKSGTLESGTTPTTLGTGTVTMGGSGSTGATFITGQSNSNAFVINAPDSGTVAIGTNAGANGFTMSGPITLNGNLTLQTFDNTISGTSTAVTILTGGVTGTGNLLLNNLGLAANTITLSTPTLSTATVNHAGSITLQGTGTGNTTISAAIGANVTGITQNSATSPMILSGANTSPGNLTVNAGLVRLSNAPDPLNANTGNDASTVTIAATGATLDLTYTGTDKVAQLVIGSTPLADGVYGKVGSTSPVIGISQITGDGTLTVGTESGPGPLDHFVISAISSPQTVGTPITGITITAKDDTEQTVTSFTGTVTFGGTGGFTGTSASFTAGVLNGPLNVTPTVAGSDLTFTVDDGVSHTGSTTITTIGHGPLDHFTITPIGGTQTVGTPITGITITAKDASDNTATGFTGTVSFSGTGGFTGTSSTFSLGVLSGVSVTPANAGSGLTLIVTEGVAGPTGTATITTIQTQYAAWAGGALFEADTNGDGVKNGLAWILGAASPNASALGLLPAVSTSGGNMLFTFKRNQASINATTALTIDVGTTLASWPNAYNVGTDTAGSTAGVAIVKDSPVSGTDTVTLTVTRAPDAKKFARLKATQNVQVP